MTDIIILAAGKGTRMHSKEPKVINKILGKPMIHYLIDSANDSNIAKNIFVVVSKNNYDKIEKSLKKYKCKYIIQNKQLGTGHSAGTIFKNNTKLENSVILLLGDHPLISSNTIKKLNDIHNSKNSLISMTTAKVPDYKNIYSHFYNDGRILRNSKNEIIGIIEPSDATLQEMKIKEINPSLYIFNTIWLKNNINKIKINKKRKEYYLTDIIKIAVKRKIKIHSIT